MNKSHKIRTKVILILGAICVLSAIFIFLWQIALFADSSAVSTPSLLETSPITPSQEMKRPAASVEATHLPPIQSSPLSPSQIIVQPAGTITQANRSEPERPAVPEPSLVPPNPPGPSPRPINVE